MNLTTKVVIVGCGQLGSRHLQAIVKMGGNLKIQVVEPNEASQKVAKERVAEVLPEKHHIKIEWLTELHHVVPSANLTIVATLATERAKILEQLLNIGHKRFLIEKIVCQSSEQYKKLIELFHAHNAKGWIDLPRRYFPFFNHILNLFQGDTPIIFHVTAGNIGLACNAIHYFDIFSALIGDSPHIKLSGDHLSSNLLPNRRGSGLIEFAGTITASTDNGSFAAITFHPFNNAPSSIYIMTKNSKIYIDETGGKARIARQENHWRWEDHEYKEIYSSELTATIAKSIINYDTCKLPTLEESYHLHEEVFRIFNNHIKIHKNKADDICPIT